MDWLDEFSRLQTNREAMPVLDKIIRTVVGSDDTELLDTSGTRILVGILHDVDCAV